MSRTLGLKMMIIVIIDQSVIIILSHQLIVICFKMSEKGEKCPSVFSRVQDDVLKCLILSTTQR